MQKKKRKKFTCPEVPIVIGSTSGPGKCLVRGLCAILYMQFIVNVVDVFLDGLLADEELNTFLTFY